MVAVVHRRLRAAAALTASLLFAQLTALPLLHVAHVAPTRVEPTAAVDDAGSSGGVVHAAAPSHDAATCAVCGILAQCRAGALPSEVVRPIPPRAVAAVAEQMVGGHTARAASPVAARAPPCFLA